MRIRGFFAVALCLALAAPAWAGGRVPPPEGVVQVAAGTGTLDLWPYTTSDFETGSDPVNLVFPNADPRAIRQELLKLDGNRPPFAFLPLGAGACTWMDAMGYEQAAWGEPEGWVGARSSWPASPPRHTPWAARSASTFASSGSEATPSAPRTSRS